MATLAGVVLSLISSQGRLTQHQVSRIQAQYAAQSGMNLAYEKLRIGGTNGWSRPATGTRYYCINGKVDAAVTCLETVNDASMPYNVQIVVPSNSNQPLSVKTSYLYTN